MRSSNPPAAPHPYHDDTDPIKPTVRPSITATARPMTDMAPAGQEIAPSLLSCPDFTRLGAVSGRCRARPVLRASEDAPRTQPPVPVSRRRRAGHGLTVHSKPLPAVNPWRRRVRSLSRSARDVGDLGTYDINHVSRTQTRALVASLQCFFSVCRWINISNLSPPPQVRISLSRCLTPRCLTAGNWTSSSGDPSPTQEPFLPPHVYLLTCPSSSFRRAVLKDRRDPSAAQSLPARLLLPILRLPVVEHSRGDGRTKGRQAAAPRRQTGRRGGAGAHNGATDGRRLTLNGLPGPSPVPGLLTLLSS